jgi:hypothetical protein
MAERARFVNISAGDGAIARTLSLRQMTASRDRIEQRRGVTRTRAQRCRWVVSSKAKCESLEDWPLAAQHRHVAPKRRLIGSDGRLTHTPLDTLVAGLVTAKSLSAAVLDVDT